MRCMLPFSPTNIYKLRHGYSTRIFLPHTGSTILCTRRLLIICNVGYSSGDRKTKIMVVGDSLVKHLRREELSSKNNNVKVVTHPGSTTEEMLDYIKPIARRKSNTLIIHTGTNDLTNGVNTMKKVRKLVKVVREIDESEKIEIGFSNVIYLKGKDLEDERNEVNVKLKKYCEGKGFVFIENDNISE